MKTLRRATREFNEIIAAEARKRSAALVDIHELARRLDQHGYRIAGQTLHTSFLGGIFSLDGIHPTNTGYAIIANEFIGVLDCELGGQIPPVCVDDIAREDPLVLPDQKQPPSALGCLSHASVRCLCETFSH